MIKTIGEFKKSLLDNIKKSSKNADDFACEVINKYCSDMVYYPIHSRGDINKMIEVEVVERNRIRIAQHDMVAEGMSRYY